ncbi:DNA-binding transcriptional response regulator [Kordiimonas aquimaris]|uniref:hypothetical protein n=1 Tax=Kordiimonas aquimaris TaxID=707591 RepID=UPI0021D2EF09|nr:hypothetical protein [Kordiimonas aquimaris]
MQKLRKLLILDDDPHYSGMLALKLRMQFPELLISSSERDTVLSGYDIYILDNDFSGEKCGAKLAEEVRQVTPESLVVVLSGTLEFSLLKRLVNCHAAGVFDKSSDADIEAMKVMIERYLMATPVQASLPKHSIKSTVSNVKELIAEWNRKLAFEERRVQ